MLSWLGSLEVAELGVAKGKQEETWGCLQPGLLLSPRCFPGNLNKKLLSSLHSLPSLHGPLECGQGDSTAV